MASLKILMATKCRSNPRQSDYPYGTKGENLARRRLLMGLISWIVVGGIVGLLAKRIVPGPDPGRSMIAVLLGMAGASVGGLVGGILSGSGATGFNVWSVLVATLGAVILLYLYGLTARRTT
jgi:uncharacterized membrane protein YeaQ/YmgE (transglycosylase-associated protein family)